MVLYGMFRQKIFYGQNSGCQYAYIQYYGIQEAVGTRRINSFLKM